jgi:DNA-binding MarR family transcriptional regulator
MSSHGRDALMHEIGMESSRWQDDVQRFDSAAAELLGVNTTDLRCCSMLMDGPKTAKELAQGTGLTPGAVTTVIDRLEAAGLARRRDDEDDRRRVNVELTPEARRRMNEIWGPMVVDGAEMMKGYSMTDLELVRGFLLKTRDVQRKHIERIEGRRGLRRK